MCMAKTCPVKDSLVNQLNLLNNKVNSLSPEWVRNEAARDEINVRREALHNEIKSHRKKGHDGQPCPHVERYTAGGR